MKAQSNDRRNLMKSLTILFFLIFLTTFVASQTKPLEIHYYVYSSELNMSGTPYSVGANYGNIPVGVFDWAGLGDHYISFALSVDASGNIPAAGNMLTVNRQKPFNDIILSAGKTTSLCLGGSTATNMGVAISTEAGAITTAHNIVERMIRDNYRQVDWDQESSINSANIHRFARILHDTLESRSTPSVKLGMSCFIYSSGTFTAYTGEGAETCWTTYNIGAYDEAGTWQGMTWPNSPITSCDSNGNQLIYQVGTTLPMASLESDIQRLLSLGVPASKIVGFMSVNGRKWQGGTLLNDVANGTYGIRQRWVQAPTVSGELRYYNLWDRYIRPAMLAGRLQYDAVTGQNGFISYDNPGSVNDSCVVFVDSLAFKRAAEILTKYKCKGIGLWDLGEGTREANTDNRPYYNYEALRNIVRDLATPAVDAGMKYGYTETTDTFPNPERGLFGGIEERGYPTTYIRSALMTNRTVGRTLVNRYYYAYGYHDKPLPQSFLDFIQRDLDSVRVYGQKMVFKFGYGSWTDTLFFQAHIDTIKLHLTQLQPVFQRNADVIAFIETGIIGSWGEWHSTSAGGRPNNTRWYDTNRVVQKEIVDHYLSVLPIEKKIQIRTPNYIFNMFGTRTPVSAAGAHGLSNFSRVGFHNDAFISGSRWDDQGTWMLQPSQGPTDSVITKGFVQGQSKYTPVGGEADGTGRVTCENALWEGNSQHYSFLNGQFSTPAHEILRTQGCWLEFIRRLGYRLVLDSSSIAVSGDLKVKLKFRNVGFSAPTFPRKAYLVLTSGATTRTFLLNSDMRYWLPENGSIVIDTSFNISGIPTGTYQAYLSFPDYYSSIASNPRYAIRLANSGVWDGVRGYNRLRDTIIIGNTPAPIPTYTLTTIAVNGAIARTPNTATYDSSSIVTLLAIPNSGYSFSGWSGGFNGNPVVVLMNTNRVITATFSLIPPPVNCDTAFTRGRGIGYVEGINSVNTDSIFNEGVKYGIFTVPDSVLVPAFKVAVPKPE